MWSVEQGLESDEQAQARSNIGVEDAISDAINALDKAEVGEVGKYVEKIKEDNGIITATLATMNTSIMDVTDTTALKKAPTTGAVKTAIENLDVPATGTGAITGFGANKTLATLSETDGKIAATFQNIALGNINHEGKIGTEANKVIVTGANGVLTTGATDGDYNSSSNKIATQSTVSGAIGNLNNSDSAVTNQFVTSVSEAAGIISVTRAQPTIGDLAALSSKKNYSIGTKSTDGTIEAQDLTVSSATDGGDSDDLTFVSSVTQASNGKISVTTKKVPYSIQFIDTDYSYEDVLELIEDGKYPVVRYESGYDMLYLPMFTSPRSSGTYIEFRGFAKSDDSTIYKIVCDPENGFGNLTSTSFVSTSETSNFLDNITYDAATAANQHGSITLKYHKYGGASTYTSVLTLRGDLDTGIAIRNVASQTPPMYKIINQRPIPTYTTNYKDRILSVNSAGDGLEWREHAKADWNESDNTSDAFILNKPDFIMQNQIGGNKNITGITLDNRGYISSSTKQGAIEIRQAGSNTYSLFGFVVPKNGQLGRYLSCNGDGVPEWAKLDLGDYTIFDSENVGDVVDLYSISAGMYNNGNEYVQFTYADGSSTTTSPEKFLVPTPLSNRQLITDANGTMQWGTPDPVCSITVAGYFDDPDELTFGSNANYRTLTAHIDTENVTLGCLVPAITRNDEGLYLKATYVNDTPVLVWAASGSGNGDVVGPSSANDNHIPLYDGTTGKLIKNSKFYFTDEAQADTAEAAKQIKTKAYNDPFRTSQQIVRASQGDGHQSTDFAYWYALNKYRSVAFGISSYGNIKITEFVQSGSDSVSPSSEQDIITSSGTGNNTVYLFKGVADKASKIDTSSVIGYTDQPVYVASDGTVTACNFKVVIGSLPTSTDTIAFL